MYFIFSVCILFFSVSGEIIFESSEYATVTISDGTVRGTVNKTVEASTTYCAFRGIPYAQPPTGDLRFAAPVKNSAWNDTLNATYDKSECVQGYSPVTGSEDCLHINVYVPKVTTQANLSVMVWIHGGAFISGNSSYDSFGPDYLLDEGVIFVSFNYRLGVFGWLSTGDLTCPGNWGLKDQILALQWVKDNIEKFSGNPNNITVFGQGSGAASISLLLQTNATKDLFHAAIMESGTSLNLWGRNVKAAQIASKIAKALSWVGATTASLIEHLREKAYATLQAEAHILGSALMLINALEGLYFAPVIEPVHDGAVIVKPCEQVLREGGMHKVPQIIGCNSNEASGLGHLPGYLLEYLLTADITVTNLAPYNLTTSTVNKFIAATKIRTNYFGLLPIYVQHANAVKFASEDQFERPIRAAANLTSSFTDVYYYTFSHEGSLSGITDRTYSVKAIDTIPMMAAHLNLPIEHIQVGFSYDERCEKSKNSGHNTFSNEGSLSLVTNRKYSGVGHGEELSYIFRSSNSYTTADATTRSRVVKMWTNFAKYCNPTPSTDTTLQNLTWPKVDVSSGVHAYFSINTTLSVEENPSQTSWEFYKGIYDTYGENPHDTH